MLCESKKGGGNPSGSRLEAVTSKTQGNTSGSRLEAVWTPSGSRLEAVWKPSGNRLEAVWNLCLVPSTGTNPLKAGILPCLESGTRSGTGLEPVWNHRLEPLSATAVRNRLVEQVLHQTVSTRTAWLQTRMLRCFPMRLRPYE